MTRTGATARLLCVCVALWVGTFGYHIAAYLFLHHDSLIVVSIDQCWFEFIGALAFAMTIDVRGRQQ